MNNPIGIFDSGIGGLTVVKQLIKLLPHEHLVYFGDTARLPYGTKSDKLIKQYSFENALFLEQYNIKLLVVACNSASAVAVEELKSNLSMPVTGVIVPGVEAALQRTKNNRIGVIGTTATINSSAYTKMIMTADASVQVWGQPCPLLVSLVEEGWIDEEITRLTIRKYIQPLLNHQIDTIILGCTHFPVIKDLLQQEAGIDITLIDSGTETAKKVKSMLDQLNLQRNATNEGSVQFFVSDIPAKFDEVGTRFLGQPLVNAQRVDFDNFLIKHGDRLSKSLNLMSING
jgi:glutamate racemase